MLQEMLMIPVCGNIPSQLFYCPCNLRLQYVTISASAYAAGSPDEVVQGLGRDGLSLLKIPGLVDVVRPKDVNAAVRYGLHGVAIFQGDVKDNEGRNIEELYDNAIQLGSGSRTSGHTSASNDLSPMGSRVQMY